MDKVVAVEVFRRKYKGYSSIVVESDQIRIELLPELGGKLVSIVYKPTDKEWMLDSGKRPLLQPEYGSTFTDWDMSGWDECFPTIIACPSGVDPDISLPDHGELWSLPWTHVIEHNAVVCSIRSPKLPYCFTRRISFSAKGRVRLDYYVENEGNRSIPFLWVPHPQFVITEPTRIILPESVKQMLCVDAGCKFTAGASYPWHEVSLLSPVLTGDARKFYYKGEVPAGWSGLFGEESGNYLIVSVPPDKVPFIGVWIDEGKYNDRVTCALEPSIGYYDSLETAIGNATAQVIPAKSFCEWHLELAIGAGDWQKAVQ